MFKWDKRQKIQDDYEDSDEDGKKDKGHLAPSLVEKLHFGGGTLMSQIKTYEAGEEAAVEQPEPTKKSQREIYQEVMMKNKMYRAAKQEMKEI